MKGKGSTVTVEETESVKLGIDSHKAREKSAQERAVDFTVRGDYWNAAIAVQEAAQHAACIKELEFQLATIGLL